MLSIIIPCFNSGEVIEACLRSIAEQSFGDFEVLIMDGASSDDTVAIVKSGYSADSRFRLCSEPDEGVYDAMNKGLALARGDWVYILGSDDRLHAPQTLENISACLEDDADLVVFEVDRPGRNDRQPRVESAADLAGQNICQQAILYRRSLFLRFGRFNPRYRICADWEFNIRCLAGGARLVNRDLRIASYSGQGLSSRVTDDIFYDELPAIFRGALGQGYFSGAFVELRYLLLSTARRRLRRGGLPAALWLLAAFACQAARRRLRGSGHKASGTH